MVGELLRLKSDVLVAHGFYPGISQIPRDFEKVVVVPEKTRVMLIDHKLIQADSNNIYKSLGEGGSDFLKSGESANFFGIEGILVSQSSDQLNIPDDLVELVNHAEKIFGWEIEPTVWTALGQPLLGLNHLTSV